MIAHDLLLQSRSAQVKRIASQLGFSGCGISKSGFLEEEAPRLEKWLDQGMHGSMSYMERNFDKRLDPGKLVEGTRTVISLTYNYYTNETQRDGAPRVSKYAYGEDYHFVIKDKLKEFFFLLKEAFGEVGGRAFVDSAPVLDKAWAQKSGLGWVGKNANLITRESGSFFFIAELLVDIELFPDGPVKDYCGTCRKCIDACPTGAIEKPYVVNGSKCISYFTIELRDESLPDEMAGKFENWMFGCDICQDVCPWNRFGKPHSEPRFSPPANFLDMERKDWLEMEEPIFKELFQKSPLKRSGFKGIKRNLHFLSSRSGDGAKGV